MEPLAATASGFATALAAALLHSLWQDALLALAAALTLNAMWRSSAARRHGVALAFLVAMLLVPAAQFAGHWQGSALPIEVGWLTAPGREAADGAFAQDVSPLVALMTACWLFGVGLMLARHAGGLRAIAVLERGPSQPLPPRWLRRFDELRRALGIAGAVAVRLSADVLTPCAARLLRPVVWLPLSILTRVPAPQLEALIAHELAHVARKDWLWNGVQCVVESLLFFHPAVWWLGRRVRREREHACDDLAVAACGDAIALAEALAALEQERHSPGRLVLAARGGSLVRRVSRLLSGPPSRSSRGALSVLGTLAIAGALLVTQFGIACGGWPDLVVESSTAGELGPGDYREIRADRPDGRRFYRVSIDADGRLTEVYREDGRERPIDADVRSWIDNIGRPSEPALSAPPLPPEFDAAFQALVERIAAHDDVVAALGTPVVMTSSPVNGNVHLDGPDFSVGDADIRIELEGPRGRATVAVEADRKNDVWTLQSVDVR